MGKQRNEKKESYMREFDHVYKWYNNNVEEKIRTGEKVQKITTLLLFSFFFYTILLVTFLFTGLLNISKYRGRSFFSDDKDAMVPTASFELDRAT